ncbi:hypothetical protein MBLNU459_g8092t1 [Dothideomycetes sp. NU459]
MLALVVETWIWWAVCIAITICRFISRALSLGSVKALQVDDWVMLVTVAFYTTLIVTINIVANASSNLFPPGFDTNTLTPTDIAQREYGSKLVLVVEQCQITTVWTIKACLLTMYLRLTKVGHKREHLAIKILMGYVFFGWLFMEIFYFGVWCRPFYNYWAVPTPNVQCSSALNHLITNATFNISSDLILMIIALPLFIRTQLPKKKKAALVGVFGLGFFVILCAILNKYYSFTQPFGSEWTYWYVRESSTALLVANLPFLWTLLRRCAPFKALDSSAKYAQYGTYGNNTNHPMETLRSRVRPGLDPELALDSRGGVFSGHNNDDSDLVFLTAPNNFQEHWNQKGFDSLQEPEKCVLKETSVEVHVSSAHSDESTKDTASL